MAKYKVAQSHRATAMSGFPFIAQIDESDCGAAALGMVCQFHGCNVSLAHIRELAGTSMDGSSSMTGGATPATRRAKCATPAGSWAAMAAAAAFAAGESRNAGSEGG